MILRAFIAGTTILCVAATVEAASLCQKRSGALFVRETCKKRETAVDPATLGLVGPKGDAGAPGEARAFACSEASGDGSLVTPCPGRPSRNVVAIVANSANEGITCFQLDPSIEAASAIALASFHEPFHTSAVNVIISTTGLTLAGCPSNSIAVMTGRYRQADPGLGMDLMPLRLSVGIAVM